MPIPSFEPPDSKLPSILAVDILAHVPDCAQGGDLESGGSRLINIRLSMDIVYVGY